MTDRMIDVSAHNGCIDWPRVAASGVKGAILRAGYGDDIRQQDKQFTANITGAAAAGLKVGVYWFSYADGPADALREWAACRQIIAPHRDKITLPVVYDYEYDSAKYYRKLHGTAPSNDLINQMVNAWLSAAKADGWKTALYTNSDYRRNIFSAATLAAWDIWLADYTGGPDVPCAIQQTGSTGTVPGITGCVDMDIAYKDYAPHTAVQIDTTGTYYMCSGGVYQIKTTCAAPPKVTSGNSSIAIVLPRFRSGNDDFWYLVAVGGKPGDKVGIYTAGSGEDPLKRLTVEIK